MPTPITEWSDAMFTSLAAALALFFAAIPKILAFVLIVVVGWFLASLVERGLAAVLRGVRFNELARRAGLADFVQKMGMDTDPAGVIGLVAKWFVRLIALVVGFDALGLPAVSQVLQQLLLWLPNLVVALMVLVIGGLAARAFGNIVRGTASEAGLTNAHFLSKLASTVVWIFAILVAVNQLGIATELVNILLTAVVGAIALGLGLAFGLGGRETAAEILNKWYRKSQERPFVQQLGEDVAEQARSGGGTPVGPMPAGKRHDLEGG